MPYIAKAKRPQFDPLVLDILNELEKGDFNPGELNYVLSRIIWRIFRLRPSYATANSLLGTLSAVKAEFYRRQVGPYEEVRRKINGDI